MAEQGNDTSRVVLVGNVDCFEYQVWKARNQLELEGIGPDEPVVVANSDIVILTSNYRARDLGVTKDMRFVRDAKDKVKVAGAVLKVIKRPEVDGLQDTLTLQEESDRLISSLREYRRVLLQPDSMIIQVRSYDEFYIDVTKLVDTLHEDHATSGNPNLYEVEYKSGERFLLGTAIDQIINSEKTGVRQGKPWTIMEMEGVNVCKRELRDEIQNIMRNSPQGREMRLIWGAIIAFKLMEFIKRDTEIRGNGPQDCFPGYEISIGLGYSLLAAKHAYRLNKPQGLTISTRTNQEPIRNPKIDWATNVKHKLYWDSLQQTISYGGRKSDEQLRRTKIQALYNRFVEKLEKKYVLYQIRPNTYTLKLELERKKGKTKQSQICKGRRPTPSDVVEKMESFTLPDNLVIKTLCLQAKAFRPESQG